MAVPEPAERPAIAIVAEVDADLRTVRGTMTVGPSLVGLPLADPLASLPDPKDDLHALRTFPGRPSHGAIHWEWLTDDTVRFEAELPRRFGTIGATRYGLFGDGGWYPAVLTPDGLPRAAWTVTVTLPPDAGGALGDVADVGTLRWHGVGERVGLAVVPRPRFTALDAGRSDVLVVSRGAPRKPLVHQLGKGLALATDDHPLSGVVAVAPLRRRLTGHAPGLAYVSDRAFRLAIGFRFTHRVPVVRGVAAALVDQPDPLDRELAAVAVAGRYDDRMKQIDPGGLLRKFSWVPQVDELLTSEQIPFYSEVLGLTWPADPVHDDLCEVLDGYAPGIAVASQLDDTFGKGTARKLGLALFAGDSPDDALAAAGVPAGWLDGWRQPVPAQDYVLAVADGDVTVGRIAPADAPPETLVVRANGVDHPFQLAPGYGPLLLPDPVRRVVLDPRHHVLQTSRVGDSWPRRFEFTAAGWFDGIELSQAQFEAGAYATVRRQYDTHGLWIGSLSTTAANLVTAEFAYLRREGPPLIGTSRPHRVRGEVSASLLDPSFYQTDGLKVGVEGTLSYSYDDRVSSDFPLRGRRLSVAGTGGGIPGTPTTWISASTHAVQVLSPHPRVAFAGEIGGAVAQSALPHRLLVLGGTSALVSVPALPACASGPITADAATERVSGVDCLPVATSRGTAAFEARWAAIRNASIPMGLAWGSELQLTAGAEGLLARIGAEAAWGVGVTAGALGLVDMLGAQPSGMGVTAGVLVAGGGPGLGDLDSVTSTHGARWSPQILLRFGQLF